MINDKTLNGTAGFWRRAGALLIDLMVINIIVISQFNNVLNKNFGKLTLANVTSGQIIIPATAYIIIFIISILALLYFTFFEYYLGQTIGDMLMRIRTISLRPNIDASKNDNNVDLWKAAIRNCYILPFFPFYVFWIIEPLYLIFYKERFLERITLTRTVYYNNDIPYKNKYKDYKLEKV